MALVTGYGPGDGKRRSWSERLINHFSNIPATDPHAWAEYGRQQLEALDPRSPEGAMNLFSMMAPGPRGNRVGTGGNHAVTPWASEASAMQRLQLVKPKPDPNTIATAIALHMERTGRTAAQRRPAKPAVVFERPIALKPTRVSKGRRGGV